MRILTGALIFALGLTVATHTVRAQAGAAGAAGAAPTVEQLDTAMKTVGKQMQALGGAMKSGTMADVAAPAKELQAQFAIVEKFFAAHKKADAVTLAQTAQKGLAATAAAAAAGDAAKAQMELGTVQGTCKQCHGVYREGMPGAYQLKAGTI